MKLVNYELQTQIEYLSPEKSTRFFTDYIHSVIQDISKPYYQRADYVGLSLQELKSKIDGLSTDIRELQQLKSRLVASLEMAKELAAVVFLENGIDRIDGNIISSLTLTKPSVKTEVEVEILDPDAVMRKGYVRFEPDIEAIKEAMQTDEGKEELGDLVTFKSTTVTVPAKVKVNTKRTSFNSQADELLRIVEAAA
ncbi:MAG: hypothetical protein KU28_09540 [Sulfurovum sp. PC08-66]|nr:MAG: hypothetical protein KU28_09540 [Sulfurovum sp. PC08-66]